MKHKTLITKINYAKFSLYYMYQFNAQQPQLHDERTSHGFIKTCFSREPFSVNPLGENDSLERLSIWLGNLTIVLLPPV